MANLFNLEAKQHILVSFDALYAMDIGLIELVKERYANKEVFNSDKLYQSNLNLLKSVVARTDINPLYLIANDDIKHEELDDFYQQFLDQEYKAIFDKAIYSDIFNLISLAKKDNGFDIEIVYYDDKQKEALESDSALYNIHKIFIKDIYKDKWNSYKYDFVYLKYLDELLKFPMLESSVVYIARYGFNVNKDNTDFNEENEALRIFLAVDRNNELGIYEPYNFESYNNYSIITNEDDDGIPFEVTESDEGDI